MHAPASGRGALPLDIAQVVVPLTGDAVRLRPPHLGGRGGSQGRLAAPPLVGGRPRGRLGPRRDVARPALISF